MKTFVLPNTLLAVLIVAGIVTTGCEDKENKANKQKITQLEKRATEMDRALSEAKAEADSQKQAATQLQEKLDQAVKAAAASSEQLTSATAKIKQLEAANQKMIDDAKTAAEVPAPIIKNGVYTFPKLVDSKMETIGENMEFSSRFGRSLIFKSEDGKRLKFDVDQLHSVILTALGIDPEAAKADQAKIDAGNKAFADSSAKQSAAYNAAMEQAAGAAAKVAADQAAAQAAQALANQQAQQARQAAASQAQQQAPMQGAAPQGKKRRAYGN